MQQDYSFIRTCERGGHGAEGPRGAESQQVRKMETVTSRGQRGKLCEREGAEAKKCRGEERGDRGGALMDRVKKEQTQERGGEGAVLGQ